MFGCRKKIVTLLALVALTGGVLMPVLARWANGRPKSTNSIVDSAYLFANSPNDACDPSSSLSSAALFYKMLVSVLLVVALGIGALYVSRKFLPKITGFAGKQMSILETVHLGPRKAVHLLKIGDQYLLIGSTAEHITKLADVTDRFGADRGPLEDLSMQSRAADSSI